MLKIVFTGQSYSGKTTLINELLKINKEFISVQESAMQVIGELKSKMGEEQKKWMMENFQQFQKICLFKFFEIVESTYSSAAPNFFPSLILFTNFESSTPPKTSG